MLLEVGEQICVLTQLLVEPGAIIGVHYRTDLFGRVRVAHRDE